VKILPPSIFLLMATCALAADQAKFETASVRKVGECTMNNTLDPGMVTLKGDPLILVLQTAVKVKAALIEGVPSWLVETDCVDIVAKMPEGATLDQLPELLQALLAERFHLATHKESRQKQGYALVVDKGGPKVKEDDPAVDFMGGRGSQRIGSGATAHYKGVMTIGSLVGYLTNRLGDPVEDQTGLKAKYDIDLSWTTDTTLERRVSVAPSDGAGDSGNDLPTALRETLGLKLERRTVSVEVVVIDHIDRIPTGN
jgi:uncharacterized protein (TIGR03435 family)